MAGSSSRKAGEDYTIPGEDDGGPIVSVCDRTLLSIVGLTDALID